LAEAIRAAAVETAQEQADAMEKAVGAELYAEEKGSRGSAGTRWGWSGRW
jgi:hypothetical protein